MQKESSERRRAEGALENGGLDPAGPGRGFYPGEADDCRRNVCLQDAEGMQTGTSRGTGQEEDG